MTVMTSNKKTYKGRNFDFSAKIFDPPCQQIPLLTGTNRHITIFPYIIPSRVPIVKNHHLKRFIVISLHVCARLRVQ